MRRMSVQDGPQRIGVFLCRCAGSIAGAVDFALLRERMSGLSHVVHVAEHDVLCAPDGRRFLAQAITREQLTHVVAAACSPREHEVDLRRALEQAGLNPYMLQMANIREHCTWVCDGPEHARRKAEAMIRAAYRRVRLHEALQQRQIETNPDILVVGGGIAGMEAALAAADGGRRAS